jgi:5-enolpyruvylshikimate-3-phosphate synthase
MSMTVCGLAAQDKITVSGADIFMESFPGFGKALMTLGAELSYD